MNEFDIVEFRKMAGMNNGDVHICPCCKTETRSLGLQKAKTVLGISYCTNDYIFTCNKCGKSWVEYIDKQKRGL